MQGQRVTRRTRRTRMTGTQWSITTTHKRGERQAATKETISKQRNTIMLQKKRQNKEKKKHKSIIHNSFFFPLFTFSLFIFKK
jgi:hypothetical protein